MQTILKDVHQANYHWRKNDESYIPIVLDDQAKHQLVAGLQNFFVGAKDQLLQFIDSLITFRNQLDNVQVPQLEWNDALMGSDSEQSYQEYLQLAQKFFYSLKENLNLFLGANGDREQVVRFFTEAAKPLEMLAQTIQESMKNVFSFVHRDKTLEVD